MLAMKIISPIFLIILAAYLPQPQVIGREFSSSDCPKVSLECPSDVQQPAIPLIFYAAITGGRPRTSYTYQWTVSLGTIVCGQNTSTLLVNREGIQGHTLKVTVEIDGLPAGCQRNISCETFVPYAHLARLFHMYQDISTTKEKEGLDAYALQLRSEQNTIGYVMVYAGRRARLGEAKARGEKVRDYLTREKRIEPERVLVMNGGYREDATIELWILMDGAEAPTPSPTIEANQVQIIGGDEKGSQRKERGKP